MKKIGRVLTLAAAALGLAACGGASDPDTETVRVGVVGEQLEHWEHVQSTLADVGIDLEIVRMTDWVTPNVALVERELDINAFQTIAFLEIFNAENGAELVSIGNTVIMPFGIYSNEINSLADIPQGAQVTIPDDPNNGGRALLLFQHAGLITLDPAAGITPTPSDITDNPLDLEFVEVVAQQLPRTLPDVTLSAINASIAVDAGLVPQEDALFLEPLADNSPFINVIATRPENANSATLRTVVEHFQTDEVAAIIERITLGNQFPMW